MLNYRFIGYKGHQRCVVCRATNTASCSGKVEDDRNPDTGIDPASLRLSHSELSRAKKKTKKKKKLTQENNKIHLNAKKLLRLVTKNSKLLLLVLLIKEAPGFTLVSAFSHVNHSREHITLVDQIFARD